LYSFLFFLFYLFVISFVFNFFRLAARAKRRAFVFSPDVEGGERRRRETLDLPMAGALAPSQINAAFRRLAKTAHPDAGGSDEHYRRIVDARDALIEKSAGSARP
jgi:hypothetical protein